MPRPGERPGTVSRGKEGGRRGSSPFGESRGSAVSRPSFWTTNNVHEYGNVHRWKEWPARTRVMEPSPLAKRT